MTRTIAALAVIAGLLLVGPARAQSTTPEPRSDERWLERHAALVKEARTGKADVVFFGDSITEGWSGGGAGAWKTRLGDLKAANFGISGDHTQHVLWRIRDGEIDPAHPPKVVVLLIGVNNMPSDTAPAVVSGVAAVLREIEERAPRVKVLLMGVFPWKESPDDPMREKVRAVNAALAALDDAHVELLDIGEKLVEPDGTISAKIMRDFLHPTAKGYEIWAEAVRGPIERMLRGP